MGKKNEAVPILKIILKLNRDYELAWLWMSVCIDEPQDKKFCLHEALRINPDNQNAKKAFEQLEPQPIPQPTVEKMGKMKYFSEDNIYINAECENCKKVLRIKRDRCAKIGDIGRLNPPARCSCGTVSDVIYGVKPFSPKRETISKIVKCKSCGEKVSKTAQSCPHCGETYPGLSIKCPRCGSMNFSVGQKSFGLGKAAAGAILLGPIGLVGGLLGRGQLELVCLRCNNKWKSDPKQFE